MPLVPLTIPPGVSKQGTDYQNANRWNSSSLVRWSENTMRPVGGWRERTSAMTGICRKILTWIDNSGVRQTAAGTQSKLYAVTQANTLADITPGSFTSGAADSVTNLGFGGLTYGLSTWGTERPDQGTYTPVTTWSLDTWGQYLMGCSTADGKIYQWQLDSSTPTVAAVVTNAPTSCQAVFISEERFVFALSPAGIKNKLQWSDQEAETTWTPASSNQAGSFILSTPGSLLSGHRLRGESLFLTDVDAHVGRYIGPPLVYGFQQVGTGCGAISANSCAVANGSAYWMGLKGFYFYNGRVQDIACEVSDYVFSDMNQGQRSKTYAFYNQHFDEVWWFYPSANSTENDRYVSLNIKEGHWSIGELGRTAAHGIGAFIYPNMVGTDSKVYEHEVGIIENDSYPVFAESGPLQIGNGDRLMSVDELIPDEKTQGDVTATFKTKLYPNGDETSHGPYSLANPTSVRLQGRQVEVRIDQSKDTDWRVGVMRFNAKAGSKR